jgi:TatD DNase family protein
VRNDLPLVDSHCHLNFAALQDDLDGVLARAGARGVGTMLAIGTKLADFPDVLAIAEAHGHIFCTVGVHPHEAENEAGVAADELIRLAEHPRVVGIGETGLDYYYDNAPREAQRENFRSHIAAARETGLPLVVHTRDADDDTAAILTEEMGKGAFPGVIHCFTASGDFARKALDLGFYISFSGIVTFKNAADIQETAKVVPAERILVETDAPYLAPVPHRGKTCEPAFVADTAAFLAELRGVSEAEMARTTSDNFFRLFNKATRAAT